MNTCRLVYLKQVWNRKDREQYNAEFEVKEAYQQVSWACYLFEPSTYETPDASKVTNYLRRYEGDCSTCKRIDNGGPNEQCV